MGGKKKGGFGVLWMPKKKKHHGHGHGHYKPEEKRNSSAFPSSSSHLRHQGIPFISGDHHGGTSEHLSVHVDSSSEVPKLLDKSLPNEILPTANKEANPTSEKVDEVQPSLSKDNSDIPETTDNSDKPETTDNSNIPETTDNSNDPEADGVDSAYLRRLPPGKPRRQPAVVEEEESCGDKCLLCFFRCLDFGLI